MLTLTQISGLQLLPFGDQGGLLLRTVHSKRDCDGATLRRKKNKKSLSFIFTQKKLHSVTKF